MRKLRGKSFSLRHHFLTEHHILHSYVEAPIPLIHSQKSTAIFSILYEYRQKTAQQVPIHHFLLTYLKRLAHSGCGSGTVQDKLDTFYHTRNKEAIRDDSGHVFNFFGGNLKWFSLTKVGKI